MDSKNPYAPPAETSTEHPGEAPPAPTGLSLSEQGWTTVTSLSKWMRIVGVFYILIGALVAAGVVLALATGSFGSWFGSGTTMSLRGVGAAAAVGVIMGGVALVFLLGGIWLRKAAFHFYDGVLSNAEASLGQGFRKLRLYLILYGIFSLLTLAKDIFNLVSTAGG